jgi:hypothetical protein
MQAGHDTKTRQLAANRMHIISCLLRFDMMLRLSGKESNQLMLLASRYTAQSLPS